MTAAERAQLRAAIDARVRADREQFLSRVGRLVCRGCGCDLDVVVPGCGRCSDRARMRRRNAA